MRFLTAGLAALAFVLLADAQPSSAQRAIVYPWCLDHGSNEGYFTTCAFNTFAQCVQTGRGDGGFCYPNPSYRPVVERPRSQPRRKRG
jgi:Protein of unknown function (DUF3551)